MYASVSKPGLSLLLLIASASHAGLVVAQPPAQAALKGVFNERMNPDVVVSGSVVVGVSSSASFDGAALGTLAVFPPPGLETVCLTVESHDGVYTSRNEYTVPAGLAGDVPVRLPYDHSRYLAELSGYADRALALKAVPAACAESGDGLAVLPVQRHDQPATGDLRFYVNAIGATDIFISAGAHEGRCQPVSGRQTSFDHICSIALPPPAEVASRNVVVRVERERYGRELPTAEVVVEWGAMQ